MPVELCRDPGNLSKVRPLATASARKRPEATCREVRKVDHFHLHFKKKTDNFL